ncbi:CBN-SRSX-33 protein [Aphelenchoides avenae]|nr:CBN-SRSX-33 protein [Aphelenchus avenae]
MSSFFDTARLFANVFLAYELFSGKNFVDMRTCYFYISIPFMGVICARLILLLTGLDRLLRVLLPVAYNKVTQPVYLTFVCSLCAFITAFFLSHGYVNSANNPDKPVICVTTAALPPLISAIYGRYAIGSTIATVVCYVTLWWCVRRKRGTSSEMDTLQKGLFKSLSYIVIIVVVCWGTASAFTFLTPWLSPIAAFFLELYSGLFVNLGCCCNYFVLYRCSATYRDTFRHQLHVCVRLARPSSVDVVVVSSMPS